MGPAEVGGVGRPARLEYRAKCVRDANCFPKRSRSLGDMCSDHAVANDCSAGRFDRCDYKALDVGAGPDCLLDRGELARDVLYLDQLLSEHGLSALLPICRPRPFLKQELLLRLQLIFE